MPKATIFMSNGTKFKFDEATTASLLELINNEESISKINPITITNDQGELTEILNPQQIAHIHFN